MPTRAYYNENDPFAAAWLRNLITAGHIAPGDVDERSILDVLPSDLRPYTQCHFFAGIGVWSYALRCAGWPDDRPVWTGSCPCQPFSAAGKRGGTADERHLWPALFHLVSQSAPRVLFGEQVASKDGLAWFDTVQADMESASYACWAWDISAAGFGAPHIRQRLYFVGSSAVDHAADARHNGARQRDGGSPLLATRPEQSGVVSSVADSEHAERRPELEAHGNASRRDGFGWGGDSGSGLANNNNTRLEGRRGVPERTAEQSSRPRGLVNGFWREADWIPCRDGKYRPIEPGSSPLATGSPNRVGRLRGYGNALTAPVATGFISAYLESESERRNVQVKLRGSA